MSKFGPFCNISILTCENFPGDIYTRGTTGTGAPGSSSSSTKTPDYSGYTGYNNYADTSYPRTYQGGDSSQGGYGATAPKPGQQGFDFKEWPAS